MAARELTWVWDESPVGKTQAVVTIPAHRKGERLPVVIAFHGLGEARKGPKKGARGWVDDYGLPRALRRLVKPPLTKKDLQGFAGKRLAQLNAGLQKQPYRGLIVVNPYTPDILRGNTPYVKARTLAKFVADELIPKIYAETPAMSGAAHLGIDGVSLGGRAALLVGTLEPTRFGAVAGLQPAFDQDDYEQLVLGFQKAKKKNSGLSFRLLTSQGDYYLEITKTVSQALKEKGVPHHLVIVPGDHSYKFNRGPGVYELLLYHDRVLRGEPPL